MSKVRMLAPPTSTVGTMISTMPATSLDCGLMSLLFFASYSCGAISWSKKTGSSLSLKLFWTSALDLQVAVFYPSVVSLDRFLSRTPQECPGAHIELRTVAVAGQDGLFQLSLG